MNYKSLDDYPEMMNIQEISEYLRVHSNTTYSFIKSGRIPSVKIGRQIRVYREDIRALFPTSQTCEKESDSVECIS